MEAVTGAVTGVEKAEFHVWHVGEDLISVEGKELEAGLSSLSIH